MVGGTVRHAVRATGRPVWTIRILTVITWGIASALAARLFLVGNPHPFVRLVYQVLFYLPIATLLALLASDRIRRSILDRPTPRVAMGQELTRIYGELPKIRTQEDRVRIELALADLDRFIEPATFEHIQLARSRVLNWLDDGPLSAGREARWLARIDELRPLVRPASWQHGRFSRVGQLVGRTINRLAPPLAVLGGVIVGRSALEGPLWLVSPAALVLGYLMAWAWNASIVPALIGAATGVAIALAIPSDPLRGPTVAGGLAVIGMLVLLAVLAQRDVWPRLPRLEVLPPWTTPDEPLPPDGMPRAG